MYPFREIEPENKQSQPCVYFRVLLEKEAYDAYIGDGTTVEANESHHMSPAQQGTRKNEGVDHLNLKAWGPCCPYYKPKA